MSKPLVTAERLRELLDYAPETGLFHWRVSRGGVYVGRLAGSRSSLPGGYSRIRLDGRNYLAHRLAWLYVHGHLPNRFLDHINGKKTDNRIDNLRECSQSENLRNARRVGRSGLKGVRWHRNRWVARIYVNGRGQELGTFATKEGAAAAYDEACRRLHGAFARPNDAANDNQPKTEGES